MIRALIFLVLVSCATFKRNIVERDVHKSTQKICLSSEGKGRLTVGNNKYIFSYESALDTEEALWQLALNFPLHKTEMFKLDWSVKGKVKFTSSIEQRILKENQDINPQSLEAFTSGMGRLLDEIIKLRTNKIKKPKYYKWKTTKKSLLATSKKRFVDAEFKNLVGNEYFGLMTIKYHDKKDQSYKMDLIVRKCLENQ